MTLTAWAVTTGEMGMRTQARGVAEAVAGEVRELTVGRSWLPARARPGPPWPDIIVSCGRRSARWALAARKASGGRILAVHVQDPRRDAAAFDLIVAMEHDDIRPGGNVIKVATALHDLTPARLEAAALAWNDRLAPLGRPLIGVAVGGDLRGRAFTLADGTRLLAGLQRIKAETAGALAITPSRRTPVAVIELFHRAFAGDPRVFLWDLKGDNPYRAILASSDRLVVTSDSVSMVSEALAAPHPVEVLDLGFARHVGFVQDLVDRGLIRRFEGDASTPATMGPVNATLEAAQAVKALIQARTGVSG
ncbi:MAG: mitochondrial fission ELM1 family protein [Caulobacteraceae bacterium]